MADAEKVSAVDSASGEAMNDRASMDRVYLAGLAWTAIAKWGVQVINWTITIAVARILVPSDYGIMGMARVYVSFALILSEAGLGAAVLRFQGLSASELRQINTFAVVLGVTVACLSLGMAGPMADFFASPDLEAVLMVMSLSFVASGVKVVPYALLSRDLQYRLLAFVDGASAAVGAVVTLIAAVSGATYWSLVIGALAESICLAVLPLTKRRVGIGFPRIRSIVEPLKYGYQIISQRFYAYVYMAADPVLIGRILGQAPLGAYNFATNLGHAPEQKISATVNRVTRTVFAAVQDSPRELARYYLRTTEALALITMPACIGIGLVARDLVLGLLGAKWVTMIVPLQILAGVAVMKALQPLGGMVGNLRGKERALSRLNLAYAVGFPPIIYFSTAWGIIGVSFAWLAAFPIYAAVRTIIGCQSTGARISEYLGVLVPAVNGTIVMTGFVLAAQAMMPADQHILRLVLSILVGALAYGSALVVMHRDRLRKIIGFMKRMRSGGSGDSAEGTEHEG